jgi:hypothetical protein
MLDLCNFVIDYMTYMLQIYVKSIRILNISQRSNCKLAVASLISDFVLNFYIYFRVNNIIERTCMKPRRRLSWS